VLVLGIASSAAGVEPISTDRPGQGTSTDIVPQGAIQVELGIQYQPESAAGDRRTPDLSAPELTLRWAPLDWLELRFGENTAFYSSHTTGDDDASSSELELATKARFVEQHGAVPTFAALFELDIPIATSGGATNAVDPMLTLLAGWSLAADWSFDANLGLSGPSQGVENPARVFQLDPVLTLEWDALERVGLFIEWYSSAKTNGEPTQQSTDGGITYLVTDNLQIDFAAGAGLNAPAPDFYVGAGLAWRWWLP